MDTAKKPMVDLQGQYGSTSIGQPDANGHEIDLSQLALDRGPSVGSAGATKPKRRKWLTRYLLPGGILFVFAALVIAAAGTSLMPRQSVQVIPVIVKRASVQQSGQPLFQAAGWIEPRPTAISVPALAPGIIDELLVVEGQTVKKGEPIARLISIDAEIAVQQAKAALAESAAELSRVQSQQRAAKTRFDKPVHLQLQLADAQSQLAKIERELANLPYQIQSAQANLQYARQSVKGKRSAGTALPGIVLQKAESELAAAEAKFSELQKREPSLQRELNALQEKVNATQTQLDLLVDETQQLDEAKASIQSAAAIHDAAKLRLQKAELELQRNTIRAPIDGRILRLITSPGMRVMGLDGSAGQDSSAVVEMYDPQRLQVRADVRLEDVPLVQVGQPVQIETASSERAINGRVLQANSSANIQKNTLEVKVELIDPPDSIRPEMLVTATFLAPEVSTPSGSATESSERIFVPEKLVQSGDSGSFVWVVDDQDRARKVIVSKGKVTSGELVEITSGLTLTDKLIVGEIGNLNNGSLVKVTGEEKTIGR
jgi:HlyD family secretion protein